MITFSEADILAWVTPLLWPFLRALALFTSMPVMGTRNVPARLRIGLAAFIALAMQPSLPAAPLVALDSPVALMLVAQQVVIGLSLGFAVRVVFGLDAILVLTGEQALVIQGADLSVERGERLEDTYGERYYVVHRAV